MAGEDVAEEYTEFEIPLFDPERTNTDFSGLKGCIRSLTIKQLFDIHFWLGRQQFITREHEFTKVVEVEIERRILAPSATGSGMSLGSFINYDEKHERRLFFRGRGNISNDIDELSKGQLEVELHEEDRVDPS